MVPVHGPGHGSLARMTTRSDKPPAGYLGAAGLWPPSAYRVRIVVTGFLALCPPAVCALIAENSGRWELFERSGSITAAIGLVVASRRYIRHSIFELAALRTKSDPNPELGEVLRDIYTAKVGLALSAFGTVIWGWGKYLGWWSFSFLAVWAALAVRDARRDWKSAHVDRLR